MRPYVCLVYLRQMHNSLVYPSSVKRKNVIGHIEFRFCPNAFSISNGLYIRNHYLKVRYTNLHAQRLYIQIQMEDRT